MRFKPNHEKTIQALMYLNKKDLDSGIVALFFADLQHLNTYGRPVTGQSYIKKDGKIQILGILNYQEKTQNLNVFSQSDLEALDSFKNTEVSDCLVDGVVDFKKFIYNTEVLNFLNEIDPFSIVI